jgi:hypothetical protein
VKYGTLFHALYLPLIIISLLITLSGCGTPDDADNDEPGYEISFNETGDRIITVKKGIGHFSMVYPDGFELNSIKTDNSGDIDTLFVDFFGHVTINVRRSSIHITIQEMGQYLYAEETAKYMLSKNRMYRNFELINESSLTVNGVAAYQYSYYFDTYPYDPHTFDSIEARYVTWCNKEVYFTQNRLLWNISLGTDPSREEHDMATIDKVLESFKVLE